MATTPSISAEMILSKIRESIEHAEFESARLRRRNSRLTGTGILAGGLSTAVGALAVTFGPMVSQGGGWELTCGIATLLTACATVCMGFCQQFAVPDHLARATACAGRLRALEVQLSLGGRSHAEVASEYEEIMAFYCDLTL